MPATTTVLAVDDAPEITEILRDYLEAYGSRRPG
jgi:DNA-binding response OmpR family regulator